MPFRSRLEHWVQIAGLVATGWVIWVTRVAPYWHRAPLIFRIAQMVLIASCALMWSALIALNVRLVMRHLSRARVMPETLETCATAVWFAPATFLILQFSPLGVASGLVLSITAARLLCEPIRPIPQPRPFVFVLMIVLAFEAGVALFIAGRPLPAAALFGLCAAMLTAVMVATRARPATRSANLPRAALGLVLTVLLTLMIGLSPTGRGLGGFQPGGETFSELSSREDSHPAGAADISGSWPGVILLPLIKPAAFLIAPRTAASGGSPIASEPFTIPFSGEYWIFRFPSAKPPGNSFVQRGTPSALSFTTTDHWPMEMKAHQKLPQPVSLSCCSRIRVAILNADRYPGTLSLELVLINRDPPNPRSMSLGFAPVKSIATPNAAVPETLDFALPSAPAIDHFDSIELTYRRVRGAPRDKSARIAIERFVLEP